MVLKDRVCRFGGPLSKNWNISVTKLLPADDNILMEGTVSQMFDIGPITLVLY